MGVKVDVKGVAGTPVWLCAPAVIVTVYVVPAVRAADGVKVKIVFVGSAVIGPDTPGVTVKVELLTVAGFIALLNVTATAEVVQGADAPAGRTVTTVGELRGPPEPPEFLSGSPHPAIPTVNINAWSQTLQILNLRITFPSSPGDKAGQTTSHSREM